MKKLLIAASIFLSGMYAMAQGHLDGIIVEKIPVPAGARAADPSIPAGAITYRVYADMAATWQFNAVFALPSHEMRYSTTTSFYNNADFGVPTGQALGGSAYNASSSENTPQRYDSYITVGYVTGTRVGVMRVQDTDGVVDGVTAAPSGPTIQTVLANFSPAFGDVSYPGTFSTFSGIYNISVGGIEGSGPNNRILIGQFTTDGDFSFEINVQIRVPNGSLFDLEQHVAENPTGTEILCPTCNYTSVVIAPTVSINAISSPISMPATITVSATANDANGTVTRVEFFRDGSSIGVDTDGTNGWSVEWPVVGGNSTLTAVARDNDLNETTSAPVFVNGFVPDNPAPVVNMTAPANNSGSNAGTALVLSANATDNGSIASVVFYNGATVLGTGVLGTAPSYSFSWTPTIADLGAKTITAIATDNLGKTATSAPITVTIQDPSAAYAITSQTAVCTASDVFCVPIVATGAVTNALGFDMVLYYNSAKVRPTGIVFVAENLIGDEEWTGTSINIDNAHNLMNISLFLDGSAPAATKFNGAGQLICVEFAKTSAFLPADSANFTIDRIYESYATTVTGKLVTDGSYTTTVDNIFSGTLLFWKDNSAIGYTSGSNLITNIYGSTNCASAITGPAVQPNASGVFDYDIANGPYVKIKRDIVNTTDVMAVINAADAQLASRVIVSDASYRPNVYQMIAMDVNRDGQVSAGDVSQMNYRTVLRIGEYEQASVNGSTSEDWLFVDSKVTFQPSYRISASFPANDNLGYSRFRVPLVENCDVLDITGGACNIIVDETYKGILLGDANGSYTTSPANPLMKSADASVVLDLANAIVSANYIDVPVYIEASEAVTSLDMAIQSDASINSIVSKADYIQAVSHFNTADKTMRFTSYSLKNYELKKSLVTVRFAKKSGQLSASDIKSAVAYVNGNPASVVMNETEGAMNIAPVVSVYPNPSNGIFSVEVSVAANVILMDIQGRTIFAETSVEANQMQEINVSDMANGMYILKVSNNDFVTVEKVIIKK